MTSKSKRGKSRTGFKAQLVFLVVLVPFQNLARFHDEATTSDNGGDTGNQFNIATGADEHGKKASSQEGRRKESACRDSDRAPDPGAARADAEPAGPDRRSETGER